MSTPLSLVGSRRPGPCNRHQKAAIFFEIPAPPFFAPVFFDNIRRACRVAVVGWMQTTVRYIVAFLFRSYQHVVGQYAVTPLRLWTITYINGFYLKIVR